MIQKNDGQFRYTYAAPQADERREIEEIRKQYLPADEHEIKLARIRILDRWAKMPATVVSIVLGTVGVLLFGLGLCTVIEWSNLLIGCILSVLGCGVLGIAYPVYKYLFQRGKRKYGEEILRLSGELLSGEAQRVERFSE